MQTRHSNLAGDRKGRHSGHRGAPRLAELVGPDDAGQERSGVRRTGKESAGHSGRRAHVRVDASGSNLWLETSHSLEPRSLAVLSAAINPEEMTRNYLRYRLPKGKDLEAAVSGISDRRGARRP